MSATQGAFEPAELLGNHFHPIGGSYASLELAIEAVKAHARNRHGGGGSFRGLHIPGRPRDLTIVEVAPDDRSPLLPTSLYKVFGDPSGP
jgi:hypothetical protein